MKNNTEEYIDSVFVKLNECLGKLRESNLTRANSQFEYFLKKISQN